MRAALRATAARPRDVRARARPRARCACACARAASAGATSTFADRPRAAAGSRPATSSRASSTRSAPGVAGFATGDAVAVEPLQSCGAATSAGGLDALCPNGKLLGVHAHGGFAEYVVVPARRAFPVPADLDPRVAALAEPTAVAVRGLRRGGLGAAQRVLVLGAGTLGLLSILAARALGADEVWISARHAAQAALAADLGATRVLAESEAAPRRPRARLARRRSTSCSRPWAAPPTR